MDKVGAVAARTTLEIAAGITPKDQAFFVTRLVCPSCNRTKLILSNSIGGNRKDYDIWPRGSARPPLPTEVPSDFAADYLEAALLLDSSAKACAALGRRCLQHLLREKFNVKHADLSKEIQEVLDSNTLPTDLADSLDAVRNLGNFAAHPNKSQFTGLIVDVEPGEAEWTLEVLEELFDFVFVRPERLKQRQAALNAKLAEAGKPPMKQS